MPAQRQAHNMVLYVEAHAIPGNMTVRTIASGGTAKLLPIMLAAFALTAAGCDRKPSKPIAREMQTEAPAPVEAPTPVPTPTPGLTRGDLVAAAATAASAFAEGRPVAAADALVGQRFIVRIPFDCPGSAPATSPVPGLAGWKRTADEGAIQLVLDPEDWGATSMFAAPEAASLWEAVEGFWISRPWLAAETCPKPLLGSAPPVPASPQSVGLAAVFETGSSRIGRRDGRAYSFKVRDRGGGVSQPPAGGYRLVLSGRIVGFPGGSAFACRAAGPDQRPVCIAAVALDRVAFEADGSVLSEWRTD